MSFIDIDDLESVGLLAPGAFAMPLPIPANIAADQCLVDTPRLRATIKGMRTILSSKGFQHVAAMIEETHDGFLPRRMNELQGQIVGHMRQYIARHDEQLLTQIFHMVQLWGGRAGRNIYVMNGGFETNFNGTAYAEFAKEASGGVGVNRINNLIESALQIKHFGVSFATKHARFWSQATKHQDQLPIYDRIIAVGCLGKNADWKDYQFYMRLLSQHALEKGIDRMALERHAFNIFDTPQGAAWLGVRRR